ncbi:MAG: 2-isopropylmalate synthase [Rhodothermales bacterium]|nr:2-isopropylmalate synthase [Rhodothermales bacterium]
MNSEVKTADRVIIFDTTLRDGEQAPGASMTVSEKVTVAQQLARLGVDVIEAGFPVSSPSQFDAVSRIVNEVRGGPTICALARATELDIQAAGDALKGGESTRIHTFIATSDIHLESKFADRRYGETLADKRETIMRMAAEAVRFAASFTSDVEFSAEDAGRTDLGYLCEGVQAAIEAGATTVNIPDTTGYCLPSEYADMFEEIRARCTIPEHVILSTHCHDDLGLAVANSLSGVLAGARQIECTINGIGERAGNASLEEVVMALRVRQNRFSLTTGIDSTLLTDTSKMVSTFTGFAVQPNKAIVGRNAFSHEAGIHQDGVLKRRDTYEIMRAEDVGQQIESIRLGRHSGRHGLFSRLDKLGLDVREEDKESVYKKFVELADRKKEVNEQDLYHLVGEHRNGHGELFLSLEHLDVTVKTGGEPQAMVRIRNVRSGEEREAFATGDGPVDALFRAIDHAVNEAHTLVSYNIRSVSEGADALGEVSVLLRDGESKFPGRARSTDVVKASAEAYMDALNRLSAFRMDEDSVRFVNQSILMAYRGSVA